VAFMFSHCGQFLFAPGTSEDAVMNVALEAGAQDVITDDEGGLEVICAPTDFSQLRQAFEASGLKAEFAEVTMKPQNEPRFRAKKARKCRNCSTRSRISMMSSRSTAAR